MYVSRRAALAIVAAVVALIVASSATSAIATRFITGADVKDGSLTGADIKRESVPGSKIKPDSVRIEHLDRDSIRAGHVHLGTAPIVVRSGKQRSGAFPSDSGQYVNLNAGVTKNVLRLSGLPAGTYVVMVMGELENYATKVGTTYANYSAVCNVFAVDTSGSSVLVDSQGNQQPPSFSAPWTSPLNMTKAITLTATADLVLTCNSSLNPSSPSPTSPVASVYADLIAFPVTSFSAR